MTQADLFKYIYGSLSNAMWDCLDMLDKGQTSGLRAAMMDALEESEELFMDFDFDKAPQ